MYERRVSVMSPRAGGDGFLRFYQPIRTSRQPERGDHRDGQLDLSTRT